MQVAKWGSSLAIRLPTDLAHALDIKEADDVDVFAEDGKLTIKAKRTDKKIIFDKMSALSKSLPDDWNTIVTKPMPVERGSPCITNPFHA